LDAKFDHKLRTNAEVVTIDHSVCIMTLHKQAKVNYNVQFHNFV